MTTSTTIATTAPTSTTMAKKANRRAMAIATALLAAVAGSLAPAGFGAANGLSVDAGIPSVRAAGTTTTSITSTTAAPGVTSTTAAAATNPTGASPAATSACTAEAIGANTDMTLLPEVVCAAGFAMALQAFAVPEAEPATSNPTATAGATAGTTPTTAAPLGCQTVDSCGYAEFFHVTTSGWVHDGAYSRECAEDIEITFISPGAASTFAPVCDAAGWPAPETVQRGSRGAAVMYVQIALVGLGGRLPVNGTFDIGTYQAVQRFQQDNGLGVDGIVGPETHALLGTGPNPPPPPTTITTTGTTTTIVVPPGTAPPCSAAAITTDTGVELAGEPNCAAGWAVIPPVGCGSDAGSPDVVECEDFDVFHLTPEGWLHDGSAYSGCAWSLAESTGMSEYTALTFSPSCEVSPISRTNIEPGSTGARVTQLQIALAALGYPIAVDGTYGPRTEAAVRDAQGRNGLEVDGIAGPSTQEVLGI